MKKMVSLLLIVVMIFTCTFSACCAGEDSTLSEQQVSFSKLSDPKLLQYVEDTIYTGIVDEFQSEDYIIENVQAVYISKEYLEEVSYNSQSDIWFGYTLDELNEQFEGTPYVFTLGENGETTVVPFQDYDDTYEKVFRNIVIGTGVILVCVTISAVTGGTVSMFFAASAKSATIMALKTGTLSGVAAGVTTGIETQDFDQAIKAGALAGSEGFKWGAIIGALDGQIKAGSILRKAAGLDTSADDAAITDEVMEDTPQWRQAELRSQEIYGGSEQIAYLAGEEVPFGTSGATRPDLVRVVEDHIEAIEVKYYDLENSGSLSTLYSELEREVSARVTNLPANATQRIVLDVTDRGFTEETVTNVMDTITEKLLDIYPNIPIDVVGL